MLQNVRAMLRQPNSANSNWSDEELLVHINAAVLRYFARLTLVNEGHFTITDTLDLVSGEDEIALPTGFFKVKNLWRKQGSEWVVLDYRNNVGLDLSTAGEGGGQGFLPDYEFRGNVLVLRQAPSFSEVDGLKVEFIKFPDTLLDGSDQLTAHISPVFKECVETYAIYKAKLAESLVSGVATFGPIKGHLNELEDDFDKLNVSRSKGHTYIQPFNP